MTSPTAPEFGRGGIPTVTVTSLLDDGSAGTLRSAISAALGGAKVTFSSTLCPPGATPATGCTITLDPGLGTLTINKDLQINGPTSYAVAVDGSNAVQVLAVVAPATVTVKNLMVSGGFTTDGGGGIVNTGTLTLTNCTVRGNAVGGDVGGGIYNNTGTLTITNCAVSGNRVLQGAGGGISNGGTLTLNNSVVSGNTADFSGGGITNSGTLTAINSTISGNTAGLTGGGIDNLGGIFDVGTITLTNTMVNGNSAPEDGGGIFNQGTLTLQKQTCVNNNLRGNGSISDPWSPVNVDQSVFGGSVAGLNCGVAQP